MREKERERERERGECVRVLCLGLLVYDNMYVMFSVCVCQGGRLFSVNNGEMVVIIGKWVR